MNDEIKNFASDPFPERKKDVKKLEEGFDIKEVMPLLQQVMQFLMTKAIHESRKQDKMNPTMLGNVSFHIDYNDITKETRLVFDKHPRAWKVKDIVFEMNNMEADMLMEKEAMNDIRDMDNPFTY